MKTIDILLLIIVAVLIVSSGFILTTSTDCKDYKCEKGYTLIETKNKCICEKEAGNINGRN